MSESCFRICRCGRHADIIARDGFVGPQFASQDVGFHILSRGIDFLKLSARDVEAASQFLQASALPKTIEEADPELLWKIELWNTLRCKYEHPDMVHMEMVHTFLELPPAHPRPPDFMTKARARLKQSC